MDNMNNDPFGSRGVAAAEQRVRNRNNMARQYTRMSNGSYAPMMAPPPARDNSAPQSAAPPPAPEPPPEKPVQCENKPETQLLRLPFGNIDTERLLLILLIAMLSSEGADFVLIAALVYVMM
ncbi:MAG: hypothetical protein ACI4J5_07395 [Oscillospiraceae bacterium]